MLAGGFLGTCFSRASLPLRLLPLYSTQDSIFAQLYMRTNIIKCNQRRCCVFVLGPRSCETQRRLRPRPTGVLSWKGGSRVLHQDTARWEVKAEADVTSAAKRRAAQKTDSDGRTSECCTQTERLRAAFTGLWLSQH